MNKVEEFDSEILKKPTICSMSNSSWARLDYATKMKMHILSFDLLLNMQRNNLAATEHCDTTYSVTMGNGTVKTKELQI